jgi:Bacterial antitoxin of type II TA system, VapB
MYNPCKGYTSVAKQYRDRRSGETLRATGLKTKREVVELGLRTLLRLSKQTEIQRLRGKLQWEGDLDAIEERSLILADSSSVSRAYTNR